MSGNPTGGTRPQFLAPYSANHNRVRKMRGSASNFLCEGGCQGRARDWALVHGKDGTDPASYVPLCRRCHYRYDGETQQLGPATRSRNPAWRASRLTIPRDSLGRFARGHAAIGAL